MTIFELEYHALEIESKEGLEVLGYFIDKGSHGISIIDDIEMFERISHS